MRPRKGPEPIRNPKDRTDVLEKLPTMPAEDFGAWCALMMTRKDWSPAQIAQALGCGINQVRVWRQSGAPRYIGLACHAIERDWPMWRAADAQPGGYASPST